MTPAIAPTTPNTIPNMSFVSNFAPPCDESLPSPALLLSFERVLLLGLGLPITTVEGPHCVCVRISLEVGAKLELGGIEEVIFGVVVVVVIVVLEVVLVVVVVVAVVAVVAVVVGVGPCQ